MRFPLIFLLFISSPAWAAQGQTLQDGIDLLHQGKFKEALPLITAIAEERPQDGNTQMALGYVLLRSGDYQRAGKVLRAALTTIGERSEIHRLLAEIAAQQGDFPAALEEIDKALRLAPQDNEVLAYKEKLTKEWQIEEKMDKNYGGNFTVTFEGGGDELGNSALAALEDAYVDLGSRFQLWPRQKTEVILYGNRDFKHLTNAPDWSGGLYDGKIRIPVGGLSGMNENLRRILYHEYAHVLIRALARDHVPLWLNEGLAQWAAGETTVHFEQRLTTGETPLPFSRFEKSFAGLSASEVSLAYGQSLSLTNFLIEYFGEAQILEVLHRLGSGMNFPIAAAEILAPWGNNFDGSVQAWQETLPTSETAPPLLNR
ncbi:MAG: tetratricopeptide repeat protein [Desulfuromonadales bacterium]|nr:tetratricopeptide repeat protein [Desulfuromonadales bacterium]